MLSRQYRFHGLGSLNFAYKRGQTVRGPLLGLKYVQNSRRKTFRVAVVVSRKVSKSAVVRNQIRRRVYEAVQSRVGRINGSYDLIFTVFNEQIATLDFADLQQQTENLLKKANVLMADNQAHDIVSTEGKSE